MTFNDAISVAKEVLAYTGTTINVDCYDGLIVKKMAASNTLDPGRSTNQTHIAITGPQMDMFPYLCADGYFYEESRASGVDLKKYFVIRIGVTIYESNLKHLGYNGNASLFENGVLRTSTTVVRSKRSNQADQLQVSMLDLDGDQFIGFRKLINEGSYLMLLKRKRTMEYEAFGIIPDRITGALLKDLSQLNNMFFKGNTNTPVETSAFNNPNKSTKLNYVFASGKGENKIFYGVPGCGKSYHIQHNILEKGSYAPENIIRTTFYQDYSNTDFVGQILPKIVKGADGEKDTVEYIFNPGPFTIALIRAISCPNEKVALIVEEINRGNAPAIFGDIFQLLDRDDDSISEYGIINVGVLDYLNSYEFEVDGEKKRYTFGEIKIPGNMDIFATMNTSDQNVYTLDTAFTRRWSKERMPNDFNGNEIKDMMVPGMHKYTWEEFVDSVNNQIQDKLDDLQVNEDKQVGAFFVKKADLLPKDASSDDKEKAKSFAYKVLEYLWDDVSKLDHTVIFNPSYKTFESLVEAYLKNGVTVFNREIFKEKTEDSTLESSLEE